MLLSLAEVSESAAESAQYLLSAARAQQLLGHIDKALLSLLKALEYTPEDLNILREIEALYDQNDRPDEVVKVLRREAEITSEPAERVPILFKLGSVFEGLGELESAIAPYQEAVNLMPQHVPVKQALGRLYGKLQAWEPLAKLFEMEAKLEEDETVKVSKLFQLAELYEHKLERPEDALAVLRDILKLRPDYQPARKHLERLLAERESWDDLLELYQEEVGLHEDDADHQVFLLDRIGMLAEEKLNNHDRAYEAFTKILELKPGNLHAIRTLARLATKREAWEEVVRMYELEMEATADQKEVVSILYTSGQVIEEKLSQADRAIEIYQKVLTLNPTYLPALRSLGRIFHQQERWEDLLSMYQREIEVSRSDDQAVALLFRMADVQLQHAKDEGAAAEVYGEILKRKPDNRAALRALEELHSKSQNYEALVDDLLAEAELQKEPKEQAQTLIRAAELCETKLERRERAAELYERVLELGFHFDTATRALIRIYSAEGMWNALSRALKTAYDHAEDAATKAAILVRCSEVAADKLGNLDSASENLEAALQLRPEDRTILVRLERICIARRDWPRAIEVASLLAEGESDPRLFAARQIRVAMMKESQLEPPQSGAEHYRLAAERVPNHPVALRALELAYLAAANWEGLAALYHREALVCEEEQQRALLLFRSGDIHEHRLEQPEQALELYGKALELDPTFLPALRGYRRAALIAGTPEQALQCLENELEATADQEHGLELRFQLGQLYQDRMGDVEQAVQMYNKVLAESPNHLAVFNRLEAIYLEQEAAQPMLDLLVTRAQAVESEEEQGRLYAAAAQVSLEQLDDPERAKALYLEVLNRDPQNAQALIRLGPIYFAEGAWDEAIDIFIKTLAVSKDPQVRLQIFRSLGTIYQEHRPDPVKCVQSFQAALQVDSTNTECLRRLASVYQEAQDWNSAVNVMLRLAEVEQEPEAKVKTLLQLGEMYRGGGDPKSAILANRKAMEIDPGNETAVMTLCELYESEEDWSSLAEATAAYVRILPPDQKSKAAPLHLKMATVFETKMNDDGRAINALKYALEAEPDNQQALERLAQLYGKMPDTFVQAVDVHRRLLKIDPFRIESYHQMHRMFERRGDHDRAFVVAEILVFLRAAQRDEEYYYHEHKSKVMSRPAASLSPADHARMVEHPNERGPLRAVLELAGTELAKVFPGDLTKYGMNARTDRFPARSPAPLRSVADSLAGALGCPPFDLWITKKHPFELFVESERPLALIVGANVERMQEKDQRFLLGRELERMKGGHHLLASLSDRELETLLWTVAKMANPQASVPIDQAALDAMSRRVQKGMSGKVRRAFDEAGQGLPSSHVDVVRHRASAAATADRAGLVMCNDIEVAVRNIAKRYPDVRPVFMDAEGASQTLGKMPEVCELLGFAVSEEYFAARAKLGFSIQSMA